MKKTWSRWLAVGMITVLMAGNLSRFEVSAQELSDENNQQKTSDVIEELLEQELVEDTSASKQVKAILYGCTEYGLRKEPNGTEELVKLYTGHQIMITAYVIAEDGSAWYGITTSVAGIQYSGYLPAEYVLCNETENIETISIQNMTGVPALQSSENAQSEVVSDSDAIAQLAANDFETSIAGFPESYKNSLRTLHKEHPNWIFVPQITNVDWNTFIKAEMEPERSLVPRSMHDAYKGKQSWAYNPETGEYYGLSGYNWVQASQAAVEYYADPRNFLTEQGIFQFELLTYNSKYQTEAGVEAIVNGTFMSHTIMPDDKVTYAKAFCMAGAQTNVSPYMLAARVRQEQGAAGTSPMISGTYPGYEGYYNFFNIGAYGTTETDIFINGLSRAKSYGWNSRYNSIAGGANILGSSYITKGQDTLYLQKFDVDDSYYGLFSHQYMQNILGAYNEGITAHDVYSDIDILDNSFVFKIPVYKNMPMTAAPRPEVITSNGEAVKGFITRLYQNVLGREPDEEGLLYWYNCLIVNGESAASVTSKFVFSKEFEKMNLSDAEFVECMYLTMMNREPDAGGKEYWLDVLDTGCSRRYVLSKFISSAEFTSICKNYGLEKGSIALTEPRDCNIGATKFVTRLYRTTLNRKPDDEGLNYWVERISTGSATPYSVAEMIVTSKEFKNHNYSNEEYVTMLYRTFFDRNPDADGFSYWINRLATGSTREEILRNFSNSQEFKLIIDKYGLR